MLKEICKRKLLTEDHKQKIQQSILKLYASDKIMGFQKGCEGTWKDKKFLERHKKNISKGLKGNQNTTGKTWKIKDTSKMGHKKEKHPFWKKHLSIEHRKNIAKAQEGKTSGMLRKKQSNIAKIKIREYQLGKKRSTETRQKMREHQINHPNKKFSNTIIEQKIAAELDKRKIKYKQNFGLDDIANVDFFLPKHNIVIECDGCYYHACKQCGFTKYHQNVLNKDKIKTKALEKADYKVYRFWGHEINESPSKCVDKIKSYIQCLKFI